MIGNTVIITIPEPLWAIMSSLIVVGIPGLLGWIVALLKQANRDRKANAKASRALLYNELKRLSEKYIACGHIDLNSRANFQELYDAYCGLQGNGVIRDVYPRIMDLPTDKKE